MATDLTPEQIEELKHRHIRSFVLRRGHISAAQERALDELFPRYAVTYETKLFDAGAKLPWCLKSAAAWGKRRQQLPKLTPKSISSDAKSLRRASER